jgi:hypothetical protein
MIGNLLANQDGFWVVAWSVAVMIDYSIKIR